MQKKKVYQTEKWNAGRGICHQVGNEEIPPLTVGLEDRGGHLLSVLRR